MDHHSSVYIFPQMFSAAVLVVVGGYTWRHRQREIGRIFTVFVLALLLWTVGFAFEIASLDLQVKIFWANFQFSGIEMVPVLWLALVMQYTGFGDRHKKLIPLVFIALLTNAVAWTNDWHHLFRVNPHIDGNSGSFPILVNDYGPWFYLVHVPITYLEFALSFLLLLRALVFAKPLYRKQIGLLLMGLMIPLGLDLIYVLDFSPVNNFNLSTSSLGVSGILVAWGLFRYRFLDIVPLARDIVLESLQEGIIVLDRDSRILDINPAAQNILKSSCDAVIGKGVEAALRDWTSIKRDLEDEAEAQITVQGRRYELGASSIHASRDGVIGKVLTLRDVTERYRLFEEIRELATQDSLTGVLNRRQFYNLAERELQCAQRERRNVAAIMIDVDNFKRLNDELGHRTGDHALRSIAELCQDSIRPSDVIGRYGGDEFSILLKDAGRFSAEKVARRLCQAVSDLKFESGGRRTSLTISLGVATLWADEKADIGQLLNQADQALYHAKQGGRNQVAVFIPDVKGEFEMLVKL